MTEDKWEYISIEIEQDSYIDIFVCPYCSTIVFSVEKHKEWHKSLHNDITDAGSMYWRLIGGGALWE
jgi:hypothetical protein